MLPRVTVWWQLGVYRTWAWRTQTVDGLPGAYDKGGVIRRGVQVIDHQRKDPDYVLTSQQWENMYKIAENSSKQVNSGITIGTVQGYTAEEVAREIERRRRQEEALVYG